MEKKEKVTLKLNTFLKENNFEDLIKTNTETIGQKYIICYSGFIYFYRFIFKI